MLPQPFIEEMKTKLLAQKAKMQADLADLKPHQELGGDLDSSAQEVEDDEVSRDLIAKLSADLERIEKALAKIEDGTYGTDDEGKEISQERLAALPWADKAI
ncbi:MAG: TraR/DksA family transcriptional regulator [Candidatus Doudnabacteria bacterium]|nr:TraR/DksA family transcriptional regulator [Candidatus Doudnabacteria bacterium]